MKKIFKLLAALTILLASTNCFGQLQYAGTDSVGLHTAKTTMSNMALYSEQFDNAAWTTSTMTVGANAVTAPDGAVTADSFTLTATTSSGRYSYPASVIAVGNQSSRRESIYLKGSTHNYIHFYSQYPDTAYIDVDLTTCAILRNGTTNTTTFSTSVGNGWCYVGFTHTPNSNSAAPIINPLKDATTVSGTSWTSTTAMVFYVWGAQVNLASSPEDYLITTSAAATLGPLCAKGYTQSLLNPSKCFPVPRAPATVTIDPFKSSSN